MPTEDQIKEARAFIDEIGPSQDVILPGRTLVRWYYELRKSAQVLEAALDEARGPQDVRHHSSDDMDGLPELADATEPVAVVIRPGGSVDVYGHVAIIDQRPTREPEGTPS